MFTFEQFKEALIEADRVAGTTEYNMFNCRARDLGDGKFSYEFDGYITCVVLAQPDESLIEWQDSLPDNINGPGIKFDSLELWVMSIGAEI